MSGLVSDGLEGAELVKYWEKRAGRATVLRPWNAECLTLRAADDRIAGRALVVPRKVREADGRARWEVSHASPRMIVQPGAAEAERIGLWRTLETVRREGRPGAGVRSVVGVELVRVTGAMMGRVCGWPRLPRKCSASRAAKLLGVSKILIWKWVCMGKLARRRARRLGRGAMYAVSYPRASWLRRRATGEAERYPHWHRSLSGEMADAAWAAERFRREGRSAWVVRVGKLVMMRPRLGLGVKRQWVCPVCGRQVSRLYLPSGPLARGGRTWSAWRWQCRWCTGLVSEAGVMADGGKDNLNLWLLKSTCGQLGGNEWRKYLRTAAG